jgi:hypothetical protein
MYILSAAALVLALSFGPCTNQAMAVEKELKSGGVFGLSGPGSESFSRMYDGVKAGVAWINDRGSITIKGDKYLLKIMAEDSKVGNGLF